MLRDVQADICTLHWLAVGGDGSGKSGVKSLRLPSASTATRWTEQGRVHESTGDEDTG